MPPRLRPETDLFIDGAYRPAVSGARFDSINLATGEVIAAVAAGDAADVDLAVKAARRSFESGVWSRVAPEERKSVLLKLAELVRANARELAVLESLDSGKTIRDCLHEIGNEVPTFFQWYAELIDKSFGKVAPTAQNTLAMIVKEPVGVVGLVLPWNFPLLMAAWKLAPALAAGCSVVLKPAEQTPFTALRLAALAAQAGVPAGVLNVVNGMGEAAGQAIGRHPDIDVVSFTGSTEVGAYFLKYAGESNLKPVGLEMGGKSPFIVLDDAPIDDPATDIGAMVTSEHQDRVLGYIRAGIKEGAALVAGSGEKDGRAGSFVDPAIFDGVTPAMTIAREEIFGPVLGIIPVGSAEEALLVAWGTDYGLHASVFTRDIDRAFHLARSLPAGSISVNAFSEGNVTTPFGGYKRSGSLARDNGAEAMDQYCQTKTIWVALRQ